MTAVLRGMDAVVRRTNAVLRAMTAVLRRMDAVDRGIAAVVRAMNAVLSVVPSRGDRLTRECPPNGEVPSVT